MLHFRHIALSLLVLLSAALPAFAGDNVENLFSYENETLSGFNLNYRKAELKSDGDSSEVVILFLHGGSGQGDDNKSQMNNPAIADVYNYLKDKGHNAVMLVPQAPYGQQWMATVIPVLKALTDKYANDGNAKVYVMGGSMGGNGTWNMLTAYPGYFTGAMPVACNTPKGKPERYVATRIYSVEGGKDRKRNISDIKSFFKKLEETDAVVRLDFENSWGHRQTCEWSFTPERLSWLFD